ncbi:MAG: hypothetical protein Q9221_005086 [Calogaya cf. arnoldii]
MNHLESIRIFTKGVEDAREEQQAHSQEAAGTSAQLTLTVDLQKKSINEVPEEVIDILQPDVERIRDFPEDIGRIKALRYFDMSRNSIKSVPTAVKDLNQLKVLKLGGNPLRLDIAQIIDAKDSYAPPEEMTEYEKHAIVTSNLKHHLKGEASSRESEGSRFGTLRIMHPTANLSYSSEGPMETPRPFHRNGSLRFPLKPTGIVPESTSDARSPGAAKPPIPTRSHYRVTSGQENKMPKPSFRRPGVTPLYVGNERHRSNSESVLQMTQNNRSKRMGMVTKKNNDLVTVKENQQHRSSFHLRGQSHAYALREWHGEEDLDNAGSVKGHRNRRRHPQPVHQHRSLAPYLSKTRKIGTHRKKSTFGETARGLEDSLSTFEQCSKDLIKSLPSSQPRQWSRLRDAQHNAEFGMNGLHHSINSLIRAQRKNTSSTRKTRKKDVTLSINACLSAVALYIQLGRLLLNQSAQLLAEGENSYIRNTISSGLSSIPGTPPNRSRSSSVAAGAHNGRTYHMSSNTYFEPDYGSQVQFDKVCNPLESTVVQGRMILPKIKEQFIHCLHEVQTEHDSASREAWSKRVRTCSMASELSDAMSKRIQTVRSQDPSSRNERSFWDLCRKYLRTIGELLEDVKAGITEGYLKPDCSALVRPIFRSSKEATRELQESPWSSAYTGNNTRTTSPASINGSVFGHSRGRGSSGSNSGMINGAIPATPLSAALGPAAQATVPSTPASGNLENCFQSKFNEKYDAYQQVQQTIVYRR